MPFEELSHTADLAVRVSADSREELWGEAGRAMSELMFGPVDESGTVERSIRAAGDTDEDLMADWLSELLAWSEVDEAIWTRFEVAEHAGVLEATVTGVPVGNRPLVGPPIKAVTLHRLGVTATENGWEAEIVFDI